MNELHRRSFLKTIASLPFASILATGQPPEDLPVVVAGHDRTGRHHQGPRAASHLDFKVVTRETGGGLFIMEHTNMTKGGPARHLHYEQEEWFYLIEGGEVLMEVGDKKFRLRPGDSVLAPRNIPHVWAYLGDKPGRMLLAFTPAGKIEAFFEETTRRGGRPSDAKLLEDHGMKLVGPPLPV